MNELWANDLAPLIFVALFGAVAVIVHPLVVGVRRRLEGTGGAETKALADEVRRLQVEVERLRAGSTAEVTARLLELEERVDFTERLLTKGSGEIQER